MGKEARESFEKVRERMRAETDEFWRKVEADHAKMLRDAENVWKDWERRPKGFNGMAKEEGGGRGEAKHAENSRLDPFQDVFGSSHHSKKMDGMTEDKNKLEVEVNVAEYLPEELRVTVEGGTVRVVGEHNEKDQEGRTVKSLRLDQSFNLPPSATGEEVICRLTPGGRLIVTAPKSSSCPVREVPILKSVQGGGKETPM